MLNKKWTKKEVYKLYKYSEQISQVEAAKRLNRSYSSVKKKASRLGIVWRQGFVSFRDVATIAGFSRQSVSRVVKEHYPHWYARSGNIATAKIPIEDVGDVVKKVKERCERKYWSLSKVARAVGCDIGTVRRLVKILYHDREMFYMPGKVKIYKINDNDAEKLITVLKKTQAIRKGKFKDAKKSGKSL
jgi:transcriptional regulator with XRE-family HTH domain